MAGSVISQQHNKRGSGGRYSVYMLAARLLPLHMPKAELLLMAPRYNKQR
jgi:hypothetical protein